MSKIYLQCSSTDGWRERLADPAVVLRYPRTNAVDHLARRRPVAGTN